MKNVEDIYPQSPTQEGMLFHSLFDSPEDGVYVGQMSYDVEGRLDLPAFEKAWQRVVDRHPALRTAFLWEGLDQPMQVVRQRVKIPFEQQDWRGLPEAVQQKWLAAFLKTDRARGFDPVQAPLMRVAVLRITDERCCIVWSFHQMVMDGWSLPLLTNEVTRFYDAFAQGRELSLPLPRPYRDYIDWLQKQDKAKAEAYWRQTLAGFTAATPFGVHEPVESVPGYGEREVQVSLAESNALHALARQNRLTLNTLVQGSWSLLLSRYSGEPDVVFGATMSGRPAELEGVEEMIGMFITTLPVRVRTSPDESPVAWLQRIQEQQVEMRQYEYSALVEIQKWSDLPPGRPLFESILVFENYPQLDEGQPPEGAVQPEKAPENGILITDSRVAEQANYPLALGVQMLPQLVLRINYDTARFERTTIHRMLEHLASLLTGLLRRPQRIQDISPLSEAERHQIVLEWNDAETIHPESSCVHELFAAQAARTPEAVALVFESASLPYAELDRRANQLAHHLIGLGVEKSSLVGLFLERSLDTVVGILAILKAGGVYVPLDAGTPRERLAFLLEDSRLAVLVTDADLLERLSEHGARVMVLSAERAALAARPQETPRISVGLDDLAYLIYTSGTTGRPKAVMVEHGSLLNTLLASRSRFRFGAADFMPHLAPFSFDISLFELFNPLLTGGTSMIATRQHALDLPRLTGDLERATLLHTVPSLMRQILVYLNEGREESEGERTFALRGIFLGGDSVAPSLLDEVRSTFPAAQVWVLYGPTEGTIICSCHPVPPGEAKVSLIGRPLDNVSLRLLDRTGHPVPIGIPGEICIGGRGVARGYLRRDELTREKFVEIDGQRFYRTGDLARLRPDGALEFLGRIDHQVKIRGFRVELGEIESVLARHPGVRETVVVAREDSGEKRLVAYVVPEPGRTPTQSELRQHAQGELPDYMVPSALVLLEALPLSPTGKVDRNALPAPDGARPDLAIAYVAPRNRMEQALAEIFAEALGVEQVGAHDNFFELGGDSISALKAVGKANRQGLRFTPKHLFDHPTIAQLTPHVGEAPRIKIERGLVQGTAPLVPFQREFLEREAPGRDYWNRSVLVGLQRPLQPFLAARVLDFVVRHHDALRLRFGRDESGWKQTHAAPDGQVPLLHADLSALPEDRHAGAVAAIAAAVQASLDLSAGPVVRLAIFDLGTDRPSRLLAVVHRLVADEMSLAILLEDLERAYLQLDSGDPIALPPKATPFKYWAERMAAHARSGSLEREIAYWSAEPRQQVRPLPVDMPGGTNAQADARRLSVTFGSEDSRALAQEAPRAYRMRPEEILLAALARTIGRWTGDGSLLVARETSGRERIFEDVDVIRTFGAFTATYPLLLQTGTLNDPGDLLKAVKEQGRAVPQRGIGYGLLRWLDRPETAALRDLPAPEIAFVDRSEAAKPHVTLFSAADEPAGPEISPLAPREYLLEVLAEVEAGRFRFTWIYGGTLFRRSTIEALAESFLADLHGLIEHCLAPEAGGYTASDFPLARLDQRTLDMLVAGKRGIEDIYPLAPLQQGMLFHTLFDPEEGMYISQVGCKLEGPLDVPALKRAWQEVVDRHAILRTGFLLGDLERPLQVVHERAEVMVELHDWSQVAQEERPQRLRNLLEDDRKRGFDIERPPLLRVTLLKLKEEAHRFIWSCHHALLDAWCQSLIFQEVTAYYEAYRQGKDLHLRRPRPYRDYIEWLQERDMAPAEAFWREALRGFTAATPLAVDRLSEAPGKGASETLLHFSPEESDALNSLARRHHLTLNTAVQGAWALLLSHYSGERDLVFGITVAGRPPELEGAEEMIGLFINTIPMRVDVAFEEPLLPWLKKFQERQIEFRQYEYTPLTDLQRWSEVPPGEPLFENILVFQNVDRDRDEPEKRENAPEPSIKISGFNTSERSNYPLTGGLYADKTLALNLAFDRSLFDLPTILRMLGHWAALLRAMAADPDVRLNALPLLGEVERHQVMVEWGVAAGATAAAGTVLEMLAAQAARTPAAPALAFRDDRMSYVELDGVSNRIARFLRSLGMRPGDAVGVFLERSLESAIAALAVWKAGGVYVPLDPAHPIDRLAFMLDDAAPVVVLSTSSLAGSLAETAVRVIRLDEEIPEIARTSEEPLPDGPAGGDLAYMIYTSGTTGRPKAVLVEHRHLAFTIETSRRRFGFGPGDAMTHLAPFSFDISLFELLCPLVSGGLCRVLAREEILDPDRLVGHLADVSRLHAVPGLMRQIATAARRRAGEGAFTGLRTLFTGGERVPPDLLELLKEVFPATEVVVLYGPTEGTIICSSYPVPADRKALRAYLGRPLDGVILHVLDAEGRTAPIGVPGELYLGGPGVVRGYHRHDELTREKFVERDGLRFYRTGDRARFLADGHLEFLGRVDQQVKVRGFRIELGEIEAALRSHPAVAETVVVAWDAAPAGAGPGDALLAGYLAYREGMPLPTPRALAEHLRRILPEYMIPSVFFPVPAIPLLPNGKLDRRALPAPGGGRPGQPEYMAPATLTEEVLADIWGQVLGLTRVGANDHFFALGGHSLTATRAVSRIRQAFEVDLPLSALFEAPTLSLLAARIDEAKGQSLGLLAPPILAVPHADGAPLSFAQQRLWELLRHQPDIPAYNLNQPLRFRGALDVALAERALTEIRQRHEVLRSVFVATPSGPIQVVRPVAPFRFSLVDLRSLPGAARQAEASRLAIEEARLPFDLENGPVLRGPLLRLDDQEHVFLLTVHHIASDGRSMDLLIDELVRFYRATSLGRPPQLPELPVQYADYAAWQREWLRGEVLESELAHWRERLAGAPSHLALPLDRPRPAVRTFRGELRSIPLSRDLADVLKALARSEGSTLFMTLLAAFQGLLGICAGQDRIVVGTPSANRSRLEVESLIGFFVNTLVMVTDVSGTPSFRELLRRVREMALDAYAHQALPFDKLVQELRPAERLSANPTFQVLFSVPAAEGADRGTEDLALTLLDDEAKTTLFELNLQVLENAEGQFVPTLGYSTEVFDAATVDRLLDRYAALLQAVAADPELRPADLAWLGEAERRQLVEEIAATGRPFHEVFTERAALRPDAAALLWEDRSISFGELDRRADRLAEDLRGLGVGPGVQVALCLEPSPVWFVGSLAIGKAGGAWAAIDPADAPEEQIRRIEELVPAVVLTETRWAEALSRSGARLMLIDGKEKMDTELPGIPSGDGHADVVAQLTRSLMDRALFGVWGHLLAGKTVRLLNAPFGDLRSEPGPTEQLGFR